MRRTSGEADTIMVYVCAPMPTCVVQKSALPWIPNTPPQLYLAMNEWMNASTPTCGGEAEPEHDIPVCFAAAHVSFVLLHTPKAHTG